MTHETAQTFLECINSCEDDDDYEFNYEDRVTDETAKSCAELSDLKQASRNRACKKKFPSGKGGKVELKLICSRSCGICPPTPAPTEEPTMEPTVSPTPGTADPTSAPTTSV